MELSRIKLEDEATWNTSITAWRKHLAPKSDKALKFRQEKLNNVAYHASTGCTFGTNKRRTIVLGLEFW